MFKKCFNSKSGFTLIEMLIVIAIIAILASVFLVGATKFRTTAYDSRRISDLQKIQSYLELYIKDKKTYPSATTWAKLQTDLINVTKISKVPNDPLSDGNYTYCVNDKASSAISKKQGYILVAKLSSNSHSALTDAYRHGQLSDITSNYTCTTSDSGFANTGCSNVYYCIKL